MITPDFLWRVLAIVGIDLFLAGDNAVVIASATRRLEGKIRTWAMFWGTIAAAGLRIIFLFVASWFLGMRFIYLLGGIYLVFLSVRLLEQGTHKYHKGVRAGKGLWDAVWVIGSADLIMSLDNVLAVAGIADGDYALFISGVVLSVPIIFFVTRFISELMNRYSVVVLAGSIILAFVGGGMIAEEKVFNSWMTNFWNYGIQAVAVIIVLTFYLFRRYLKSEGLK